MKGQIDNIQWALGLGIAVQAKIDDIMHVSNAVVTVINNKVCMWTQAHYEEYQRQIKTNQESIKKHGARRIPFPNVRFEIEWCEEFADRLQERIQERCFEIRSELLEKHDELPKKTMIVPLHKKIRQGYLPILLLSIL